MRRKLRVSSPDGTGPGDVPYVTLSVRSSIGDWTEALFVVDTGAGCTSMPSRYAARLGLHYRTDPAAAGVAVGLVGRTERFRDAIHVMLFGNPCRLPCDFLVSSSRAPYGVLGRLGFLQVVDFCYRSPYMYLSRKGSWRTKLGDFLRSPLFREHPFDRPL